jgi:transcriptional regulator with XRE-family HTH domain
MTEVTSWASFIKAFRDYIELTQYEFAQMVEIKPNQVSRWERGIHQPNKTYQRALKNLARKHDFPIPVNLNNSLTYKQFVKNIILGEIIL